MPRPPTRNSSAASGPRTWCRAATGSPPPCARRTRSALIGPPALAAVRDGGQLIAVRPFQGDTERGITISLVLVGRHLHEGARVAELADLTAKGVLTPRVAELIPAERADAHRKLEAGGVRGRLVLTF
jgi:NADPH:quinone reductase